MSIEELFFIMIYLAALIFMIKATMSLKMPQDYLGPYEAFQLAHVQCYTHDYFITPVIYKNGSLVRYSGEYSKVLWDYENPC